jgi:uncharacterized protein YbaP (TraB family)
MRLFPAVLLSFLFAAGADAACVGRDMIADLPQADRQALQAATDAVPYPSGNRWRATKGDQVVDLVGTYHLDDPRLAPMLAATLPALDKATALLVEAGPEEEKALKDRIAREPSLVVITDGPTLPEALPPEIWDRLSQAMADRGIPGFMAAKFRPWYLSMMLSIPTCAMSEMGAANGLDKQLIDAAKAHGTPVQALEPYDTVFHIFDSLSEADQLSMVTSALAMEEDAEDMSATLAAQYFAGENRLIWEFMRAETLKLPGYTPERVAQEFGTMEEVMINARNRAWIPVIDAAAAKGPVLAAFGALHLGGDQGVLNLLAQDGWTITRLDGP